MKNWAEFQIELKFEYDKHIKKMKELKELKTLRQLLLNDNFLDNNIKSPIILQIDEILNKEQFDVEQIVGQYETNIKKDSSEIVDQANFVLNELNIISKEIKALNQNIPAEKERILHLISRQKEFGNIIYPRLEKETVIYQNILKDLQSFADQLVNLK